MDALSVTSLVSNSTLITDLLAAASSPGATATTPSSTDTSPTESVRTLFSDFARNLLSQQAADPSLSIDAALTNNLLSPSINYSLGGQLYTSAGLLQSFATNLFLSQLGDAQNNGDTQQTGAFGLSGSAANTLLDFVSAYEQISLLGSVASLGSNQSFTQLGLTGTVDDNTSSLFSRFQPTVSTTSHTSTQSGQSSNSGVDTQA